VIVQITCIPGLSRKVVARPCGGLRLSRVLGLVSPLRLAAPMRRSATLHDEIASGEGQAARFRPDGAGKRDQAGGKPHARSFASMSASGTRAVNGRRNSSCEAVSSDGIASKARYCSSVILSSARSYAAAARASSIDTPSHLPGRQSRTGFRSLLRCGDRCRGGCFFMPCSLKLRLRNGGKPLPLRRLIASPSLALIITRR
jgi:hypothetical protein